MAQDCCNPTQVMQAAVEAQYTGAFLESLSQAGLGIGDIRIYTVLGFTSLEFQGKVLCLLSCPTASERVFKHIILFKIGTVMVKTVPWPPRLTFSWVMFESLSDMDLHSLVIY